MLIYQKNIFWKAGTKRTCFIYLTASLQCFSEHLSPGGTSRKDTNTLACSSAIIPRFF